MKNPKGVLTAYDVRVDFNCTQGRFAIALGEFTLTELTAGLELTPDELPTDMLSWEVMETTLDTLIIRDCTDEIALGLSFYAYSEAK